MYQDKSNNTTTFPVAGNPQEVIRTTPAVSTEVQKGVVPPTQDPQRVREAQDLLRNLQILLKEGETPGLDIMSSALQKAEELSYIAATQPQLDPETRKTLEDISALLLSARQVGRDKGVEERLQRIYLEAQKALKSTRDPNVSPAAKEASKNIMEFVQIWRPLFFLLVSSRDFRQLLLDVVRITRNVAYSYSDSLHDTDISQQFVEGAHPKEVARTVKEHLKEHGTPELSDEEWDTIQDDLQRVLVLLAKEPSYREGIEGLFRLGDMFSESLASTDVAKVSDNVHIRRVVAETEELVAAFSATDSLEDFKFHLRNLLIDIQHDENLRLYLQELKHFILSTRSEDEIRSEQFKIQSRSMARRGREFAKQFKHHDNLKPFLHAAQEMIDNVKNDEFLQILRHHAGIVRSDLSYVNPEGQTQVDTDMLSKLQFALLPVLADALKYIPIPRMESSDPKREFWLDNIVLCGYDILPENLRFHLETDSDVSIRDIQVKGTHTKLVIVLDHLKTEIKDVEFFFFRKSFPSVKERGRATFRIKGDGAKLTFVYNLESGTSGTPKITQGYADFTIGNMEIDFEKSTLNHPVLVPMLTSLFKSFIKQKIEKQVESNLVGFINKLGKKLTKTMMQVNRPFLSKIEFAKDAVKSTQMAQVYDKRREILE